MFLFLRIIMYSSLLTLSAALSLFSIFSDLSSMIDSLSCFFMYSFDFLTLMFVSGVLCSSEIKDKDQVNTKQP